MIEDVKTGHLWIASGDKRDKTVQMYLLYLLPTSNVTAEISLSSVAVAYAGYADANIWFYTSFNNVVKFDNTYTKSITADNVQSIMFRVEVQNAWVTGNALIYFRSKTGNPSLPTETSTYVVHDKATGEILSKFSVVTLPGATILSRAKMKKNALDLTSESFRKPKSEMLALKVQEKDLRIGVEYAVDVKKKKLVEKKVWR